MWRVAEVHDAFAVLDDDGNTLPVAPYLTRKAAAIMATAANQAQQFEQEERMARAMKREQDAWLARQRRGDHT